MQFGADPNVKTHGAEMTPLMTACLLGSTLSTVALLEYGADKNAFDANRTTALMHACGNGNDECVRALLDAGTLPCLPLTSIVQVLGVFKFIVVAGADFTPENYFGKTALQQSMHKQRVGCIRLLLAATNRARDRLGDAMIDALYTQDRLVVRPFACCIVCLASSNAYTSTLVLIPEYQRVVFD